MGAPGAPPNTGPLQRTTNALLDDGGWISQSQSYHRVCALSRRADDGDQRPPIARVATLLEERKKSRAARGFEVRAGRYHVPVHRLPVSQAES
jgi:hypothetical protein